VVAGVVLTWLNRWPVLWLPLAAGSMVAAPAAIERSAFFRVGRAALTTLLGYGAVWNANILAARVTRSRSWDSWFRSIDLAAYDAIGVGDGTYRSLFPLVHARWATELLSQAYLLIMAELFVVLVLSARESGRAAERLVGTIFTGYAVGLLIFLIAPSVGPCIAFPESIDFSALPSQAAIVMRAMIDGFADLSSGVDRPVIAYFVAFPSLHALLAIVLQWHLRSFRFAFFLFAPVNLFVLGSTVILGFHYLIDVAGAALLAPVVLLMSDPSFRRSFRSRAAALLEGATRRPSSTC
jgi:membrane-associated phospholipid phosphatase